MVVFSSEPYVVSPLTQDAATIAAMVPVLSPNIMPVLGSDISRALKKARQLMKQGGANQGQIILISDSHPSKQAIQFAKKIHSEGFTISVLGVGRTQGVPIPTPRGYLQNTKGDIIISRLDRNGLEKLAHAGGGRYADLSNDNQDINDLLITPKSMHLNAQKMEKTSIKWHDEGRYLLLLLVPLVALAFRRGWLEELVN